MKKYFLLISLFLTSCGAPTARDLRSKGEAETAKLAHLLHEVNTKDELQRALPKIEKSFNKIAELVLDVRALSEQPLCSDPSEASDELFAELARLYEMPGCRHLLEAAQGSAIDRLNRPTF